MLIKFVSAVYLQYFLNVIKTTTYEEPCKFFKFFDPTNLYGYSFLNFNKIRNSFDENSLI